MFEEEILTYAIGDVHGRLDLLERLVDGLRDDARARGEDEPLLLLLGDYVDLGPDARGVVEFLMRGIPGFRTVALKGNHDAMMWAAWHGNDRIRRAWLQRGGVETLASYGWRYGRKLDIVGLIPEEHVRFLGSLATEFDDGRRLYVHAGIDPTVSLNAQTEHDKLWIRAPFLEHEGDFGRFVVHGHTATKGHPDLRSNRVNVDTDAYHTGILTAAAFDPGEVVPRFVMAVQEASPGIGDTIRIVEVPRQFVELEPLQVAAGRR